MLKVRPGEVARWWAPGDIGPVVGDRGTRLLLEHSGFDPDRPRLAALLDGHA